MVGLAREGLAGEVEEWRMTTSQGSGSMPSQIHIENGQVFEGTKPDPSRMIDLNKAENKLLVGALQSEGHTSASDWDNGDYRVEGSRLVPTTGGTTR